MTRRLRLLHYSMVFPFVLSFLLAEGTSHARPNHDEWQTGTLVNREAVAFAGMPDPTFDCFWPQAIFTVDSSTYTYQFVGFASALTLTRPTIVFRIYPDGDVLVRGTQSRHSIELKLFKKFAGPNYGSITMPPRKQKHRDWVNAEVSAASPNVLDFTRSQSPCAHIFTSWEYTIDAHGESYALLWPNVAPLNVTIHGVSQIAFGKSGVAYLVDDNGKERKLRRVSTKTAVNTPRIL